MNITIQDMRRGMKLPRINYLALNPQEYATIREHVRGYEQKKLAEYEINTLNSLIKHANENV